MILKGEISAVDAAIFKTKGMFNKQAVAAAQRKFTDFANFAEEKLTHFENLASNQAAQITRLSEEAAEAVKKLRAADVEIAYVKADLEKANTVIESQEKRLAKTKERIKKPDITLDNSNILKRELKKSTGTELQTEITPQGRKVGYKVISADETAQRSGTFDEITQRRVSTTTANGDTVMYDIAGNAESIIKGESKLPKLIQSKVETDKYGKKITETFDDGTTVVSEKYKNGGGRITKTDKDDKLLELMYEVKESYKSQVDHYKYQNGRANIKETVIKAPYSDEVYAKYSKKLAYDEEGNAYNREATLEMPLGKIKGKVSKTDKFGDIEEYTLTANFNPDKEVHLKSYKSLEGTCSIEQSGREYTLVPKELKITMADGHKYYIKCGFNNSIRAYKPLDGGNDKNVQVIIDELKQQNVFKELINV